MSLLFFFSTEVCFDLFYFLFVCIDAKSRTAWSRFEMQCVIFVIRVSLATYFTSQMRLCMLDRK